MKHSTGFTLIELSIVLVIIGLIVGAVLVGRDLIKGAELQRSVSQIEKIDAAFNSFIIKYNCIPGDCKNSFGFTHYSGAPYVPGDGDGRLSSQSFESINAVSILGQAGILDRVIRRTGTTGTYPHIYMIADFDNYQGRPGYWVANYIGSRLLNVGMPPMMTNAAGHYYWAGTPYEGNYPIFLPSDASFFDTKIDDGLPRSGRVLATGSNTEINDSDFNVMGSYNPAVDQGASGAASNFCVTNDVPNQYNIRNISRVSGNLCSLTVKAAGF